MKENNKNQDKTVCITGAGGGIGRAIAIEMNKEGYNVACADINLDGLNQTIQLLSNNRSQAIALKTDVSNVFDIKKMVNSIFKLKNPKIIYGGSVNTKNINELKKISSIDGFLIGGSSQKAKNFIDIIKKTIN